jgi:acyl carrier protein
MTRDEIFARLRDALVELFELDPKSIVPQASLMSDLDLDSIDAIDLMLKLKEITGKKIQPEAFRHVRTVQDIVDAVDALVGSHAVQ